MAVPKNDICHNHPPDGTGTMFPERRCTNPATVELAPGPMPTFYLSLESRTYYCRPCADGAIDTGYYCEVSE